MGDLRGDTHEGILHCVGPVENLTRTPISQGGEFNLGGGGYGKSCDGKK